MKRLLFIIALSCLLTACSGLLENELPAKQYFMLQPLSLASANAASPRVDVTLSVKSVPGLDTDRIQALGPDSALQRYQNARWPDNLTEVIASVLRRSIESADYIRTASIAPSGSVRSSDSDWSLDIETQAFYGRMDSSLYTQSVEVAFSAIIECHGEMYPAKFSESVKPSGQGLSQIVAAHQRGLDQATRKLLKSMDEICTR